MHTQEAVHTTHQLGRADEGGGAADRAVAQAEVGQVFGVIGRLISGITGAEQGDIRGFPVQEKTPGLKLSNQQAAGSA